MLLQSLESITHYRQVQAHPEGEAMIRNQHFGVTGGHNPSAGSGSKTEAECL
ncbi:MAG: hypothetical protein ACOX5R_17520 [bacterium]